MGPEPIFLAIDAGNTRIKWGWRQGDAWLATGALETASSATLGEAWRGMPKAARAIASNVAGAGVAADLERACAAAGVPLEVIGSQREQLGVRNAYVDASQLGSDRWAALLAAHYAVRGDKLVVNAGTALTIDALTGDGDFLGGLIVPGPALMRRALDRGTAGLRRTEGEFQALPRSTPDAITTGALLAGAGAVARFAEAMASRGHRPAQAVLSGGAAAELAPHLPIPVAIRENLVLEGLVLIARSR